MREWHISKLIALLCALALWAQPAALAQVVYQKPKHAAAILSAAMMLVERPGLEYVFGAQPSASEEGKYDCSSFVQRAARQAGLKNFPRSSRGQFALFSAAGRVWLDSSGKTPLLRPGDLIFFTGTFPHNHECPVSHVMIYAGQNLMIGAQSNGVGYFRFHPSPPLGVLLRGCPSIRRKETIYAYARPSWSRVRWLLASQAELFSSVQ